MVRNMNFWRLYHFCSEKEVVAARVDGISKGVIPLQVVPNPANLKLNTFRYIQCVQWLTKNPHFIPLDAGFGPPRTSLVPGRKAEYRITVRIPHSLRSNLEKWVVLAGRLKQVDEKKIILPFDSKIVEQKTIPLDAKIEREINIDLGEPAEWYCFGNIIWPQMFESIDRNPSIPKDIVDLSPKPVEPGIVTA
jgi:hypothetical protein